MDKSKNPLTELEKKLEEFNDSKSKDVFDALDKWLEDENTEEKSTSEHITEVYILVLELSKMEKTSKSYLKVKSNLLSVLAQDSKNRQERKAQQSKKTNLQKRLEKETQKHMSDVDTSIPIYSMQDIMGLLVHSQRKVEGIRSKNEIENLKLEKMQNLLDICEALSSVRSKHTNTQLVLREKLLQILDAFVMQFGGVAFFSPLDIQSNASLGAKKKDDILHFDEMEFIDYVWSTSTQPLVDQMKTYNLFSPKLSKTPHFKQALLSKRFMFLNLDLVHLPENHFAIESALIIPVVINRQSVGLLGLANGSYHQIDAEILYEILPKMWTDVILESVAKANKQHEDTLRLQNIEKRVELGKKMLIMLNNILKEDTSDIGQMSKAKYLRKKLRDIANFIEQKFGGMVFVAPTKVEVNLNLITIDGDRGTSSDSSNNDSDDGDKVDPLKFMNYIFSDSGRQIRATVMKGFSKPVLKKTKTMKQAVEEQKVIYISDTSKVGLPEGHFPLSSLLLVPIVVNMETCGLVGLANGKFTELDGYILYDVLGTLWFTILQESISKMDLKFRDRIGKNSLPEFTINQIKRKGSIIDISSKNDKLAILILKFGDIINLTKKLDPNFLLDLMNSLFAKFEQFLVPFSIQKIETFSDTMIAAAGLDNLSDIKISTTNCANYSTAIHSLMEKFNSDESLPQEFKDVLPIKVKISIITGGPVVSGVTGTDKIKFDLFSDQLDLGKSLLSSCPAGSTVLSSESGKLISEKYNIDQHSEITFSNVKEKVFIIKGKK